VRLREWGETGVCTLDGRWNLHVQSLILGPHQHQLGAAPVSSDGPWNFSSVTAYAK
jgi:hypothetical protein